MRLVAVCNHKGGVGKTTTVMNLAAALARRGRRVLLLDIDPQACLTVHLGFELGEGTSIYQVLTGGTPLREAVRATAEPNLALVPSDLELAGAEMELASAIGRESLLKDALHGYLEEEPYDYVLIDCPPSLGLLTINALCAVREIFIPLQTEFLALRGMNRLVEVVTLIRRRLNPLLRVTGIIPTLYRSGTLLAREVTEEIQRHFGSYVFTTKIRNNVRLAEAPSHGKSIFAYAADSLGAQDYERLAQEVEAMPAAAAKPITHIHASHEDPAAPEEPAAPEVA